MDNRITDAVLSQEELTKIRERAEKATSGVWRVDYGRTDNDRAITSDCYEMVCEYTTPWDAEFIAHAREDIPKLLAEIERLRDKRTKMEITETLPGGGKCPACDVRLIGKANYCGKCGQRVGWKVYGGNVYDRDGGVSE